MYISLALYFYSERFYAGISALDIFATPNDLDILSYYEGGYSNNIIGQYNFLAGYYYPIDQQMNWAIEPSLLLKKQRCLICNITLILELFYQDLMWFGLSQTI